MATQIPASSRHYSTRGRADTKHQRQTSSEHEASHQLWHAYLVLIQLHCLC